MTSRAPAVAGLLVLAMAFSGCAPAPPPAPPPAPAVETEPAPAPHAPDTRQSFVVKSDKTQLRDEPTTKSAVLGRLAKDTRVIGLEEKDGWVFVRLPDNRVGWIRADLLRRDGP